MYEYKCSDCDTKFEMLHKSVENQEDLSCPNCNSSKNKKLFSSFSSSNNSDSYFSAGDCASGQCQTPVGGCSSGLCGLN
ncbi:MAG: zinc ribbon domain-containing protein [Ignavibacteria bacterium]|nr:zinc ribbon domain-containing protein [Ignavibacteria bacterium]